MFELGELESKSRSRFELRTLTNFFRNSHQKEALDKLRELAVVLTQKVRENTSIDWTIKESVKAKLKVIIKRTLHQFGYPPDMQLLATEMVLKQSEMIASELALQSSLTIVLQKLTADILNFGAAS